MPAGQKLMKWTWMLDNVEVKGVVRRPGMSDGTPVGATDDFDLELDDNYKHLVASSRGNNPLPWYSGSGAPLTCIHVESYSDRTGISANSPAPYAINRVEAWPLPSKPSADEFLAVNPDTGTSQPLKVGDHVRLVGRWCVENQHEDLCWTRFRGMLKVGCVWMELHPFRWDLIELIEPLAPDRTRQEIVSLAAPVYEETYQRGGLNALLAGVAGHVFVAEDGSNYHNSMTANVHIKAPELPAGFTPHSSLIEWTEEIFRNGTGLDHKLVRSLNVTNNGIQIVAKVVAPTTQWAGSVPIASIQDPANNKSIFQARYRVKWKPRLFVVDSRGLAGDELETIQLGTQTAGGSYAFQVYLANRGPDPLQITKVEIHDDANSVFQVDPAIKYPLAVAPMSTYALKAVFSPASAGSFTGKFEIHSNDPARGVTSVQLSGAAVAPVRGEVEVNPSSLDFGVVRVGDYGSLPITALNKGNADAYLLEMIADPASQFHPPPVLTNQKLSPGQSQILHITYAPTQRGSSQDTLVLRSQGGGWYFQAIPIEVKGQASAPHLVLNPATLDFGSVQPGTSKTLPFAVTNDGDVPLTVKGVYIRSGGYSFLMNQATTFPLTLAPSSTATLQVTFTAGSTPGQVLAEWDVESDDPTQSHTLLTLRGLVSGPAISVLPDVINFGHVQQLPALARAEVRNVGSTDLIVRRIILEKGTHFSLIKAPAVPATISAGSRSVFQVRFQATTAGMYQDRLIVTSNDPRRTEVKNTVAAILD